MSYKIAFDASTKATGFAVFDNNKDMVEYGVLKASSPDVIKRIQKIIFQINELINKYDCDIDLFILEEVHPENEHTKIMHTHRALMWIQAAINFLIHERCPKAKVEYIFPNTWRKNVGMEIGKKVRDTLKQEDIQKAKEIYALNALHLNEMTDDEADALLIGYGFLKAQPQEIWFGRQKKGDD